MGTPAATALFLVEMAKQGAVTVRINPESGHVNRFAIPDVIAALARADGVEPDPPYAPPEPSDN